MSKVMRNRMLAPVLVMLMLSGCSTHRVTRQLVRPIDPGATWFVGEITDALPDDVSVDDRPDVDLIESLRRNLLWALIDREYYGRQGDAEDSDLLVTGSIIDYEKGSGMVRFLVGLGAGDARLVAELKLLDRRTGEVLFVGSFRQEVNDWMESGDKCIERMAQDFANALAAAHQSAPDDN